MASAIDTAAAVVRPDRLTGHLEWFARVRRDTAGPGEQQAAEYIAGRLRDAGVPVQVHEFDAFLSYPIRATLEVLEPEGLTIACLTHSFARSTGPAGVIAELTDLPAGTLSSLAGTRDYGFLRAQLLREYNRIRAALRDASALALETTEALRCR